MMERKWEIIELGKLVKILDKFRRPVTKKDRAKGSYPYYGATGIQDYVDSYIFDGRYLLVGEDGAKWMSGDKSAFIIEGKSWVNNHAHVLKVGNSLIDKYLEFFLIHKDLSEYITGAIIPKLTQQSLKSIPIPVPPLPVQTRIVDELDCLQGILSKKRQQLAEYHSLAQAIFHQMFGDPVVNEKGWEVKRLGEVFDITSSKRIYQNELLLEGIPFYKVSDIVSLIDKNEVVPNSFISEYTYKDLVKNGNVPQANDLLITSRGTLGKCYIVKMNDKFYFQDGMVTWLRQKEEPILPTYVSYVFLENSFKSYLYKNAKHTTVDYISIQHLSKMLIPLPPLPLQQSFAARIAAIDSQRERLAASIRELETLLACRMETLLNCPQA